MARGAGGDIPGNDPGQGFSNGDDRACAGAWFERVPSPSNPADNPSRLAFLTAFGDRIRVDILDVLRKCSVS